MAWRVYTDAQTGRNYYHNKATGVTQWTVPHSGIVQAGSPQTQGGGGRGRHPPTTAYTSPTYTSSMRVSPQQGRAAHVSTSAGFFSHGHAPEPRTSASQRRGRSKDGRRLRSVSPSKKRTARTRVKDDTRRQQRDGSPSRKTHRTSKRRSKSPGKRRPMRRSAQNNSSVDMTSIPWAAQSGAFSTAPELHDAAPEQYELDIDAILGPSPFLSRRGSYIGDQPLDYPDLVLGSLQTDVSLRDPLSSSLSSSSSARNRGQ